MSVDIARLGFEVDTRQLVASKQALQAIADSAATAGAAVDAMSKRTEQGGRAVAAGAGRAAQALARMETLMGMLVAQATRTATTVAHVGQSSSAAATALNNIATSSAATANALAAVADHVNVVATASQAMIATMERLDARLVEIRDGLSRVGQQARRSGRDINDGAQEGARGLSVLINRLRGVRDQVQDTEMFVMRLRTALLGIAGGLVIRNLMQTAMTMQRVQMTLAYVTGSAALAQAEFDRFARSADRLGVNILETAGSYTQFLAAARTTGLALDAARITFEGVSAAMLVMGKDSYDTQGSLLALQQILSKGKVTAEELTQQLGERLPGAMAIAAQAMGMTTRQLQDAMQRGELDAREFVTRLGQALHDTFVPMIQGMTDSSTRKLSELDNAFDALKLTIVNEGFLDALIRAVELLTEIAQAEAVTSTVRGMGLAFGFMAENVEAVVAVVGALFALFAASHPIAALITLLVTGALWIIGNWEKVKQFFGDLFTVLGVWAREAEHAIVQALTNAANWAMRVWHEAVVWFRSVFREIQDFALDFALSVAPTVSEGQRAAIMASVALLREMQARQEASEPTQLPVAPAPRRTAAERAAFVRLGLADPSTNDARIAAWSQSPTGPDETIKAQIEGYRALRELQEQQAQAAEEATKATGRAAKAAETWADRIADIQQKLRDAIHEDLQRLADEEAALMAKLAGDERSLDLIMREIELTRTLGAEGRRLAQELTARTQSVEALRAELQRTERAADDLADAFGRTFETLLTDLDNAVDAARALLVELARIAAQFGVMPLFRSWAAGLFEGLLSPSGGAGEVASTAATAATAIAAPGAGLSAPLLPNARGNAFVAGNVVAFAKGGLPDGPTLFPMANGRLGLMNETLDQEGIFPLARTRDGKLGVHAIGADAPQQIVVHTEVHVHVEGGAANDSDQAALAGRVAEAAARAAEAQILAVLKNQLRPGNLLNPMLEI